MPYVSAYEHLSSMLERTRSEWLLTMYELYIDDSGTHGDAPMAIAACYISTKRGWDNFVREYDNIRTTEHFDCFHMTDFAASPEKKMEPFCDWDGTKRKRVYQRIAKTINDNKRIGLGVAFPKELFDKVVPELPEPLKTNYGKNHFAFAFKVLLTLIAIWRVKSQITLPMRYVFDRMGKGKGEIIEIWEDLDKPENAGLRQAGIEPNGYSFEDKSMFKPLQAADILAWQMNWHFRNVILQGKRDIEDCHSNFEILRRDQEMRLAFMTKQNFANTVLNHLSDLERMLQFENDANAKSETPQ